MRKVGGFGTLVLFVVACSSNHAVAVADAGPLPGLGDSGPGAVIVFPTGDAAAPLIEDSGACIGIGDDCAGNAAGCCNGSACVYNTKEPSKSICAANCLTGSQCNTGCCTVLIEGTAAVCAPVSFCPVSCAQPGSSCISGPCCANAICVSSTVTGTSCAARCTASGQCTSGCCAPLQNTGELVCSPRTFCP